jgi:hypothetical protein
MPPPAGDLRAGLRRSVKGRARAAGTWPTPRIWGRVTGKSHGMITTYASPAFRQACRNAPLRPYISSAAAHRNGGAAAASRLTCAIASRGLVANARSSGMPAACRRGRSSSHRFGMYTSKSAHARPFAVT